MNKKLSLGAVQYFWSEEKLKHFYREAAESSVDIIYLGETVCLKRREFSSKDFLRLAHEMRDAGKEVVLSSLTLVESPADLREIKRLCENGEFLIEANDMGAVQLLSEKRLPFVGGSALNCFNPFTLRKLVDLGLCRFVLPIELHRWWAEALFQHQQVVKIRSKFETEILAWGHLPLAWSARCFTARSEGLPKDLCQLACKKYPNGRTVQSQEGKGLFLLNGTQTQSGVKQNLLSFVEQMAEVDILRLSPEESDTFRWLELFKEYLMNPENRKYLVSNIPVEDCNGYWLGGAGKDGSRVR